MKVLLLTGSHPRHFYIVNELLKYNLVAGHLVEEREEFVPEPPTNLEEIDRINFIRHFKERDEAETRNFIEKKVIDDKLPTYKVSLENLNSTSTVEWIRQQNFDLAISYGVHKLEETILTALGGYAWNIHGGLSPWYKGNITLFWPFMMLKPNWAGMTIHKLSNRLDAGEIVHHSIPNLSKGDGIHDVACNAVKTVARDLINILSNKNLKDISYLPQKQNGKLWVSSDWTPQHLRFIYNVYNNDIVDHYLEGKLETTKPKLMIENLK